jgi:hypothetical protein
VVEIPARLCVWRIFGSVNDYSDRPEGRPSWHSTPTSIGEDMSATISFGDVPEIVTDSLRALRAHANYFLNDMFGNHYAGMSIEERRGVLAGLEANEQVDNFNDYPTFLTLEVSRPVKPLLGDADAHFLWAPGGDHPTVEEFTTFERQAREALDALTAWILPTLGTQMQVSSVLGKARACLVALGKAAIALPQMTMSGRLTLGGSGWGTLPFAALETKLGAFAVNAATLDRYLSDAGRWLSFAFGETDTLRKFVFAYCGLEVLVQQTHARVRPLLTASFHRDLPGLPIDDLLWPSMPDDAAPFRNLVFMFASLASVVAPTTASDDTAAFKAIAKARNSLAHGGADDSNDVPANEAIELLRRYVIATATAVEDGRLC